MNDIETQIATIVQVMLESKRPVTSSTIEETLKQVISMSQYTSQVSSGQISETEIVRYLEAQNNVWIGNITTLDDWSTHKHWLPNAKSDIVWRFWKRYETYLKAEQRWPSRILLKFDELTDEVLSRLENPAREGPWDRRGMVVGQVQSGKTSNYIGLICKAVDAGYRVIIILAGWNNNDLRSQTQIRIDNGFLGFDTQMTRALKQDTTRIGAGLFSGDTFLASLSFTSSAENGDFRSSTAGQTGNLGNDPAVFVVKKNTSILRNLVNWLQVLPQAIRSTDSDRKVIRELPLLLIDDETDHASINIRTGAHVDPELEPSAINGRIRELLGIFEKSAYVGYTATPFANIFINSESFRTDRFGEDLFPRSFIINLPAPSNYVGPVEVFGLQDDVADLEASEELPIVRIVDDYGDVIPPRHKRDWELPNELPESMRHAVRTFILSCAARHARGHISAHKSMLIHVTRWTNWQQRITELVQEYVTYLIRQLEFAESGKLSPLEGELRELWQQDFVDTTEETLTKLGYDEPLIRRHVWDEIRTHLYPAASRIQVKELNGVSADALEYRDYTDGLTVIAIGGDKLSRGLTLEGLSVSYYLRASKMYDTLMQMGRWFGYKPGYVDLCRLYTSCELVEWYEYITMASEELRQEFNFMAKAKATPEDYGLKVRTHPDGLKITGANRLRSGTEMQVTFAGSVCQTYAFHKDKQIISENFNATESFLQELGDESETKGLHYIWKEIPGDRIILSFLKNYTSHPSCRKADTGLLAKYIRNQMEKDELTSWTVALLSKSGSGPPVSIAGKNIRPWKRSDTTSNKPGLYTVSKSNILSPSDEYLDFSEEEVKRLQQLTKEAFDNGTIRTRDNKPPTRPSGIIIRTERPAERGLLLLYPLYHTVLKSDETFADNPVIGFVISFPASSNASSVSYRVNNIFWNQEFGDDSD